MDDSDSDSGEIKVIPLREKESVTELIRSAVSDDGSLHLDRIQTELLIRWMTRVELTVTGYERTIESLRKLISGLKGEES